MNADRAFSRLQAANPKPAQQLRDVEPPDTTAFLAVIQQRSHSMQTRTAPTPTGLPPRRPRKWLVPALSAAVIVAAAVVAAILFAGGTDQPDVATTIPEGPQSSALDLVQELVAAANAGDLEAVLEILSPQANCDVVAPGTEVETCEGFWGANIAMGGVHEIDCAGAEPPYQCTLSMTSEAHAALGLETSRVRSPYPIALDANGLLITQGLSGLNSFFGTHAVDLRVWAYMQERYPELNVNTTFGVNPNTAEGGAAMLEAARELNDPLRLVGELESAFENLDFEGLDGLATSFRCSLFTDVTDQCSDVAFFLNALNADVTVDCGGRTGVDGEITCPVTLSTDIHDALGAQPTVTEAVIGYRGGTIERVAFNQVWSNDASLNDGFLNAARSQEDLFDGDQPSIDRASADRWLAFATSYPPGS